MKNALHSNKLLICYGYSQLKSHSWDEIWNIIQDESYKILCTIHTWLNTSVFILELNLSCCFPQKFAFFLPEEIGTMILVFPSGSWISPVVSLIVHAVWAKKESK